MQEWTYRHGVARLDNAGEKTYPSKLNVGGTGCAYFAGAELPATTRVPGGG